MERRMKREGAMEGGKEKGNDCNTVMSLHRKIYTRPVRGAAVKCKGYLLISL